MSSSSIAIIGCGNLGLSIIGGLLNSELVDPKNIYATRRNISKIQHLAAKGVRLDSDNKTAVKASKVIILAVKPYNVIKICEEIKSSINVEEHIIVSTATGISIAEIEGVLGTKVSILRAMPNTAADVEQSLTCICANEVSKEDYQLVDVLFNGVGKTVRIEENLMEAATVLGACGVAFVLRFMRAMVQGGIQIGFDARTAEAIVNQTVKGASELLLQNGEHPEFEIDKVTTPKGCTITGLNEMEHNGFSSSLIKGIVKSYEKISD